VPLCLETFDETKQALLLMMWQESCQKRAEIMPVEERIALSSPDGVARAVAEDPELDAGSDDARRMQLYCLFV
jgi:hypothetical protein